MWLKTKDCLSQPYLVNIDKYTEIFIPYHEDNEPAGVNAYIRGVENSYTAIARSVDPDTANKLVEAIADAIASGERFFDVDEFLALSKLQEGAKK